MTQTAPKRSLIWFVVMLLALLSGLCTVFAGVITAAEAWREHAEAQWPLTTACVDDCSMTRTSTSHRHRCYVRCRLSYEAGGTKSVANVYSSSAPGRDVSQYPPNQIAPLEEWIANHPPGTPIAIRYNPDQRTKVVLVATDLPGAALHTASNLRVLALFSGSFMVLFTVAWLTRPRSLRKTNGP
jgi:uncharacterized protein DUF3592